mgnify:CR=1 FL=1
MKTRSPLAVQYQKVIFIIADKREWSRGGALWRGIAVEMGSLFWEEVPMEKKKQIS